MKICVGKTAVFLQVGFGGVPKSSLETWRWLSLPILHSMPGHEEPGLHGVGLEILHFLSEDMVSMMWKRVCVSEGSKFISMESGCWSLL